MNLARMCCDDKTAALAAVSHELCRFCNDEMLRIIGCTIEHVIGRSNRDIFQGIEPEEGHQEQDDKIGQEDARDVYLLDIIDASGFHHTGSALSHKFRVSSDAGSATCVSP